MIPSHDAIVRPSGEMRASNGPTAPIEPGLSVSSEFKVPSGPALRIELVEAGAADGDDRAVVGLRGRRVGVLRGAVGRQPALLGPVGRALQTFESLT